MDGIRVTSSQLFYFDRASCSQVNRQPDYIGNSIRVKIENLTVPLLWIGIWPMGSMDVAMLGMTESITSLRTLCDEYLIEVGRFHTVQWVSFHRRTKS